MSDVNTIKGLFYIYKMQNKILYKNDPDGFPVSKIYAICWDIYPIYDETEESKYFESCYSIGKSFVEKILDLLAKIDDEYISYESEGDAKRSLPDYWSFLDRLGIRRHSTDDFNVYKTLRYLFLANENLKYILDNFVQREKGPVEYQGLTRDFDEQELTF